ncbi:MAG: hypothetical protein ACMVY4_12550 [Minwuia sp.]|uniref:hypothetical protein n=1 Tax=Minwuia sp. TaxID=2493630 RepID=UPI003A84832C
MAETLAVNKIDLDDFTDAERWEAEDMVRRFGAEAENMATERMIEVLDDGDVTAIISQLRLRRCIRKIGQKDPYMRRLTDKIAAAAEQALEQGKVSLAARLKPAFKAAREVERKFQMDRRAVDKAA